MLRISNHCTAARGAPGQIEEQLGRYLVQERYFIEFSRQLGQAAEKHGLTEEQLMREQEEDKRAIYQETYEPRPRPDVQVEGPEQANESW
jgi:hypothetical protein